MIANAARMSRRLQTHRGRISPLLKKARARAFLGPKRLRVPAAVPGQRLIAGASAVSALIADASAPCWSGQVMEWSGHGMVWSWNGLVMEWSGHQPPAAASAASRPLPVRPSPPDRARALARRLWRRMTTPGRVAIQRRRRGVSPSNDSGPSRAGPPSGAAVTRARTRMPQPRPVTQTSESVTPTSRHGHGHPVTGRHAGLTGVTPGPAVTAGHADVRVGTPRPLRSVAVTTASRRRATSPPRPPVHPVNLKVETRQSRTRPSP
jgi:hypothetical protein